MCWSIAPRCIPFATQVFSFCMYSLGAWKMQCGEAHTFIPPFTNQVFIFTLSDCSGCTLRQRTSQIFVKKKKSSAPIFCQYEISNKNVYFFKIPIGASYIDLVFLMKIHYRSLNKVCDIFIM